MYVREEKIFYSQTYNAIRMLLTLKEVGQLSYSYFCFSIGWKVVDLPPLGGKWNCQINIIFNNANLVRFKYPKLLHVIFLSIFDCSSHYYCIHKNNQFQNIRASRKNSRNSEQNWNWKIAVYYFWFVCGVTI